MVYKAIEDQMDTLEDLLPGIEDFLCTVLANESLSPVAEEQRQYFVERLDIIKLPPSVPPRPHTFNVKLFPAQEVHVATIHEVPHHDSVPSMDDEEFAAYQREISRQAASSDHENSPDHTEVKVYDDIDLSDSRSDTEGKHEEVEESMYEIPQVKRTLSDSGYEKASDLSIISKSPSTEEPADIPPPPPPPIGSLPPPLPPRRDRSWSDANSRDSIGSLLDDKSTDSLGKPNLNREFSVASQPEKQDNRSEKSDDMLDDFTDDPDRMSCDSLDDSYNGHNVEMLKKLGIKLPKPVKKKKRHRKLGLSLSSSLWEVRQPFHALEDVTLSGELHFRSKLTWTCKVVAIANGRLVCYKREKLDSRPSFVILLTGYEATFQKRDGKRNFEIKLTHDNMESHLFLVEFKEWAQIWCEHINAAAQGKKPAGPSQHLARGTVIETGGDRTYNSLGKVSLKSSNSNLSTASSDGLDQEPGTVKVKKRDQTGTKTQRMGTFAYKATQFFESLGKKSIKKSSLSTSAISDGIKLRSSSSDSLSPTQTTFSEPTSPLSPESGILQSPEEEPVRHVQHKGYLDIYSSFNKRKWGKRWCMVQDNTFECYRTPTSVACELEIFLKNCVLRRAIEETKSELGLMLTENDREKITIEPLNWNELGPWLRILMKETSTPVTPEGLEAYMAEEIHPYHAIVESPLSDPFPGSPVEVKIGQDVSNHSALNGLESDDDKLKASGNYSRRNRDSGNCSGETESVDSKTESLERNTSSMTHSSYSDSSLQRIKVSDNGDLYTQIRRPSAVSPAVLNPETSHRVKPSGSKTPRESTPDKISEKEIVYGSCIGFQTVERDKKSKFDFENPCIPSSEPDGSLVDEIFSQFSTQMSEEFLYDKEKAEDSPYLPTNTFDFEGNPLENLDNVASGGQASVDDNSNLDDVANTIMKSSIVQNSVCDNQNSDLVCSSSVEVNDDDCRQLDEDNNNVFDVNDNNDDDISAQIRTKKSASVSQTSDKHSSLILRDLAESDVPIQEKLEELRTKLVQLKKDRISIRDRKQQTSSQIDKDFLEAEFERLHRECTKVTEEIECLEKLNRHEDRNQNSGSDTHSEIDV